LFPRAGHCRFLEADEFKLNSKRYAVKQDGTATSPSVIKNNPFQDPVSELMLVAREVLTDYLPTNANIGVLRFKGDVSMAFKSIESQKVRERPTLAKFYVSAVYAKIKEEYWREFLMNIQDETLRELRVEIPVHTHTHTHSGEIFSRQDGITNDAGTERDSASGSEDTPESGGEEDEDYDFGSSAEDEDDDEGGSYESGSPDDCEGY